MDTQPNRFAIKPLKVASFTANSLVVDCYVNLFPHEGQKLSVQYSLQIVSEPGSPLYNNGTVNSSIDITYEELDGFGNISDMKQAIVSKVATAVGAVLV